jgi:hypothetical protein
MYLGNPAFRIFGSGWDGHRKAMDIIRTTNDVAFPSTLALGQCVQTVFAFGTVLYGLGTSTGKIAYSRIFRSIDNGVTWTLIWIAPLDSTANFNGIQFASNVGVPTGEAEQQVFLGYNNGTLTYVPKRLFDGGAHYQGLFYVKMPTLPAAGGDIYVWFGNPAAVTASDNTIWYEPAIADIRWQWRLDEGAGGAGTAIDEAIDAKDGILTPGASGAWVLAEGRYAGPVALPYIVKTGAHYNFHETGYVNITGSGVDPDFQGLIKNYTVIAWIKSIPKSGVGDAAIFIKGYGTSQYGLVISGGSLSYHISNAGDNHVDIPDLAAADTNGWHMVGAALGDGGAGKTNVYLICDGLKNALGGALNDYSPVVATRDVRIGAGSDGSRLFPGEIDEVTIYNRELTALEIQQIYEMRNVAATEPTIADQHYYDYLVEGRRRRLTNLLTHARRFFAAGLRSRQFRR